MTITEILQELGLDYRQGGEHHHVTHNFIGLDCPRCSPNSGKFKLGIPITGSFFAHCWTCGRIPVSEALAESSNLPFSQIRPLLGDLRASPWQEETKRASKVKIPEGVGELLAVHRKYLKGRGFDPDELVRLWNVQGIGIHNRLAWRLFIPVTQKGRVVSWTTRAVSDNVSRRYVTASASEEEVSIKHCLLGEQYIRHSCIVVEGPLDAIRIGPGCVALCGVVFSPEQVEALSRIPRRAICFDSEEGAQQRAKRLADQLSIFAGTTHRVELDSPDPGSASKREVEELRRTFLE